MITIRHCQCALSAVRLALVQQVATARPMPGWTPLLQVMAFISINLGIFNLLDVPSSDGGGSFSYCHRNVCAAESDSALKGNHYQTRLRVKDQSSQSGGRQRYLEARTFREAVTPFIDQAKKARSSLRAFYFETMSYCRPAYLSWSSGRRGSLSLSPSEAKDLALSLCARTGLNPPEQSPKTHAHSG